MPSLGETWRTSTRSGANGACVEVRRVGSAVQVRDSKDRDGAILNFSEDMWRAFLARVHAGDFDRPITR